MPEHLRTLVVLLALATAVFILAKGLVVGTSLALADYRRRRNLWFALTLVVFLAYDYWVYVGAAGVILHMARSREPNRIAMYFFLLFAVPAIAQDISGLGVVKYFFTIDYLRLLALVVLLPTYLDLRRQPQTEPFGRTLADKLVAGHLILGFFLIWAASTFTHGLRAGVFYAFVDVFLPYYVASRYVKDLQGIQDALTSFVVAALVLSAVAAFESARHWLLYAPLPAALGTTWSYGGYLERGEGVLRAQASVGHAIPLGYTIAVAIGMHLFLRTRVKRPALWLLALALLVAGIISPVSRGGWLGAAAIALVYAAMGSSRIAGAARTALAAAAAGGALIASGAGEGLKELLNLSAVAEDYTVSYRQKLLQVGVQVVLQRPLFGAYDYMLSPAMQEMRQGQGIIDIVNTYLGVALSSGLVGLALFTGIFLSVLARLFRSVRSQEGGGESRVLGQALFATLIGIMIMIASTASITVVPIIYWTLLGFGAAYVRMVSGAPPSTGPVADGRYRASRRG